MSAISGFGSSNGSNNGSAPQSRTGEQRLPQVKPSGIHYSSSRTRLRTRQACEPCRKRKRKCDGLYPCDQCADYEYSCQYASQQNSDATTDLNSSRDLSGNTSFSALLGPSNSRSEHDESISPQDGRPSTIPPPPSTATMPGAGINFMNRSSPPQIGMAVLEPMKGRFSYAHGGIVLPRKLGQQINLPKDLKFHSYGWNLGLRQEQERTVAPFVRNCLSFQEISSYSKVYFEVVDPIYHVVDRTDFFDRCTKYWLAEKIELDEFEVVISSIVALGSFFSAAPCVAESQLVEHAKNILDSGCVYAPARLSMDQAAAWVLRTLYLRLTTRPHLSWYASCSAVHVVEAMGLHADLGIVDLAGDDSLEILTSKSLFSRHGILESAIFLNAMISAEYGRSRISLQGLELLRGRDESIKSISPLWSLTRLMVIAEGDLSQQERTEVLHSISDLPDNTLLFNLLKTDVANHVYRLQMNSNARHARSSVSEVQVMLSIIKSSLAAARNLLATKQPWWNLISTPFQSALIFMAIDSNETLNVLSECMSVLMLAFDTFKSSLVLEVIQTVKCLLEGLERKKLEQVGALRQAVEMTNVLDQVTNAALGPPVTAQDQAVFDMLMEGQNPWNLAMEVGVLGNYSTRNTFNFQ